MASLKARLERLKSLGLGLEPASELGKHRKEMQTRSDDSSEDGFSRKKPESETKVCTRDADRTQESSAQGFLPGWEKLAPQNGLNGFGHHGPVFFQVFCNSCFIQ